MHELPDTVSAAAAVAMIGTGRTTMAILDDGALGADDVVVVTAAAGGIGSLLVQFARRAGAVVVGLAGGPAKVERVRQLGADLAVDYTAAPVGRSRSRVGLDGRRPTVAFDGVGGEVGRAALELLDIGGRLVMYGWASGKEPTQVTTADLFAKGLTVSVAVGAKVFRRPGGIRGLEDQALEAVASGAVVPLGADVPAGRRGRGPPGHRDPPHHGQGRPGAVSPGDGPAAAAATRPGGLPRHRTCRAAWQLWACALGPPSAWVQAFACAN